MYILYFMYNSMYCGPRRIFVIFAVLKNIITVFKPSSLCFEKKCSVINNRLN
jgi:hypothetical protein